MTNGIELTKEQQDALDEAAFWKSWDEGGPSDVCSGWCEAATRGSAMSEDYELLVNDERTVMVRIWKTGDVEVAMRDESGAIWGPPVAVSSSTDQP
jgi:hypothetical protein